MVWWKDRLAQTLSVAISDASVEIPSINGWKRFLQRCWCEASGQSRAKTFIKELLPKFTKESVTTKQNTYKDPGWSIHWVFVDKQAHVRFETGGGGDMPLLPWGRCTCWIHSAVMWDAGKAKTSNIWKNTSNGQFYTKEPQSKLLSLLSPGCGTTIDLPKSRRARSLRPLHLSNLL